jgi:gas vesicle protein
MFITGLLVGIVVGFVVGILVGRASPKTTEKYVGEAKDKLNLK